MLLRRINQLRVVFAFASGFRLACRVSALLILTIRGADMMQPRGRTAINGAAAMDTQEVRGGLLFDKDGTIFDFAATWAGVIDRVLDEVTPDRALQLRIAREGGYDPETGHFAPGSLTVAAPLDEVAALWAGFLPDRSAAEIEDIANRIVERAAADGALVPAVPDLPGLLDGLRRDGFILGIATHDSEAAAIQHLSVAGVIDRFDFIAGYDSGHGLKPGPGMLLAFCAATGLAADRVVMVGDSIHDLGVAPAAGAAMAVGVLTGPATRADLAPLADHVLDSIGGLPDLLRGRL